MNKGFTVFLEAAEVAGGLGVALRCACQLAALGLILVMLGVTQKKILVRKTGFWGKHGDGWSYNLIFVVVSLVVVATGGGRWVLWG